MLRVHFLAGAILCLAAVAPAQNPDPHLSYADVDPSAVGASIFNVPDGTGNPLTAAYQYVSHGVSTVVDATIRLTLIDEYGEPVVAYPREDMWLESAAGTLIRCDTFPDAPTDINGQTTWSMPLKAGGWGRDCPLSPATEGLIVWVANPGFSTQPIPLRFNSADINGDLQVTLTDVSLFVNCFLAIDYCYLCDYNYDGVRNLSDIAKLALALGAECP